VNPFQYLRIFHDLPGSILKDDILARLLTFPNVVVTSHQAF
jgi:D-lactate dehydrogenase